MIEIRKYTHQELQKDISCLTTQYPFIDVKTIGTSVCGRDIFALTLGTGENVHWNAAHHGMEWVSSWVIMKFIGDLCDAYQNNQPLEGYDIKEYLLNTKLHIVPMVNPDGVEMAINGGEKYAKWNANANGVDLNHNYDANWLTCKCMELEAGINKPGPTRFGDTSPVSQPETQAIVEYTLKHNFSRAFALHSQGEEIFWNFDDIHVEGARELADKMAEVSGYVVSTPEKIASCGGYKDWFIKEFKRPAYTIELGKGENPLPRAEFSAIYKKALALLLLGGYN